MRLKIIANGDEFSTKIVNADTGEELRNVVSVSWSIRAGATSRAVIELFNVPVEIEDEFTVSSPKANG